VSVFPDRRLAARAGLALALANARYWSTVAPLLREQLGRHEQRARTIRDPVLQALALEKLHDQRFHAQLAATLATLAPRAHRGDVVQAIVAIEVLYDYLDGLTEQPGPDPLADGHRLYRAATDAIDIEREPRGEYYALHPRSEDDGYLDALVLDARSALARLPTTYAITEAAERCTTRFAEAQIRAHAVPRLGSRQLEEWAASEAPGTMLGWLEYFAGAAASVLGLHALVAAAADSRTTGEDAARIAAIYLYIGVVVTMLDSLIDHEHDLRRTGEPGYTRYYGNHEVLMRALTEAVRHAMTQAESTPNGAHHVMTLVGVVALYTSAPTARTEHAQPITENIQRELRPVITPTLTVLRTWRLAKRARALASGSRKNRLTGRTRNE
jgi:tetraprenyl-beta-curcumene synthase